MPSVTLPWPDARLNPNSRTHHMQKARLRKTAREAACIMTCSEIGFETRQTIGEGDAPIRIALRFCPPDKRRRDLDNMLASSKALLDGVADALRADDNRFELTLTRGEPVKRGAVEVTFQ